MYEASIPYAIASSLFVTTFLKLMSHQKSSTLVPEMLILYNKGNSIRLKIVSRIALFFVLIRLKIISNRGAEI